jgi:hypothetical protein
MSPLLFSFMDRMCCNKKLDFCLQLSFLMSPVEVLIGNKKPYQDPHLPQKICVTNSGLNKKIWYWHKISSKFSSEFQYAIKFAIKFTSNCKFATKYATDISLVENLHLVANLVANLHLVENLVSNFHLH